MQIHAIMTFLTRRYWNKACGGNILASLRPLINDHVAKAEYSENNFRFGSDIGESGFREGHILRHVLACFTVMAFRALLMLDAIMPKLLIQISDPVDSKVQSPQY